MFEKVNPSHPDKLCDRIAGAIVDIAYAEVPDPRNAVEVLLGHGICHIIVETDIVLPRHAVDAAVERIAGKVAVDYVEVAQDRHLAQNQEKGFRCGDNGIFKGIVTRYDKLSVSASFQCSSTWAGKFKTYSKRDSITVSLYDIETHAYKNRSMRLRSFKAVPAPYSEKNRSTDGLWTVSFTLEEF